MTPGLALVLVSFESWIDQIASRGLEVASFEGAFREIVVTSTDHIEVLCLEPSRLEVFLERRRALRNFPAELSLAENLVEALRKANEFVPSMAGAILLDNPLHKVDNRADNALTFVSVFGGESSGTLLGQRLPSDQGIAGHVYLTGEAYYSPDVSKDQYFFDGVDRQTDYRTESIVAIPIRIEKEVCGVLELMNRVEHIEYSPRDRDLLVIFADYISISIQNVLDGRRAQEIAKRDNLTGLYNDRYLHLALFEQIDRVLGAGRDLAVVFLDLDFFKRVNDSHGHLAGSQVLREVGHLLGRSVENSEGLAARYGGDEFVLILPGTSVSEAVDIAETLRLEILNTTFCSQPGEIQREVIDLTGQTCSIGVASLRSHAGNPDSPADCKGTLLRLADAAMYVAKETGRNRTAVAGQVVSRRD